MSARHDEVCARLKIMIRDAQSSKPKRLDEWRRRLAIDEDLGYALARGDATLACNRVRCAVLRQHGKTADVPPRTVAALRYLGVALEVVRR